MSTQQIIESWEAGVEPYISTAQLERARDIERVRVIQKSVAMGVSFPVSSKRPRETDLGYARRIQDTISGA